MGTSARSKRPARPKTSATREAVRAWCKGEFERIFVWRWMDWFGTFYRQERDPKEERGRQVLLRFRAALEELQQLAASDEPSCASVIAQRLSAAAKPCREHWLWKDDEPLIHPMFARRGQERARLVFKLDTGDTPWWPLDERSIVDGGRLLPPRVDGREWALLDAHEMAVISLLVGNWPGGGRTVAEVVDREARAMRLAIKRYGRKADRGGPPFALYPDHGPMPPGVTRRVVTETRVEKLTPRRLIELTIEYADLMDQVSASTEQ